MGKDTERGEEGLGLIESITVWKGKEKFCLLTMISKKSRTTSRMCGFME